MPDNRLNLSISGRCGIQTIDVGEKSVQVILIALSIQNSIHRWDNVLFTLAREIQLNTIHFSNMHCIK